MIVYVALSTITGVCDGVGDMERGEARAGWGAAGCKVAGSGGRDATVWGLGVGGRVASWGVDSRGGGGVELDTEKAGRRSGVQRGGKSVVLWNLC